MSNTTGMLLFLEIDFNFMFGEVDMLRQAGGSHFTGQQQKGNRNHPSACILCRSLIYKTDKLYIRM
jgi:hypothetical protein